MGALPIFLVAASIRLLILLITQMHENPYRYETTNIAQAIVAGGGFSDPYICPTGPTGHLAPLFPTWLTSLLLLVGPARWHLITSLFGIAVVSSMWAALPLASSVFGLRLCWRCFRGNDWRPSATREANRDTPGLGEHVCRCAFVGGAIVAVRLHRSGKAAVAPVTCGLRHGIAWGAMLLLYPSAGPLLPAMDLPHLDR